MIGDFAEAEDAVQEAYARAWQRWGRVSGYADPTAWVRTVAHRVAVSRYPARLRTRQPDRSEIISGMFPKLVDG
jgi:RNA polymerase sigma-70 factor (ECF subfamily)